MDPANRSRPAHGAAHPQLGWCAVVLVVVLSGCAPDPYLVPVLDGDPVTIVPRTGFPAGVAAQASNNNLDIVHHEDRLFFAWRTGPSHFASPDVWLYVVSRAPGGAWEFEASFHHQTDLREPRFLAWSGSLWLYFAELGDNPSQFEPGQAFVSERNGPGDWTDEAPIHEAGFIPWRTKVIDDVPYMLGYVGGENIYTLGEDAVPDPVDVHFLTTTDGYAWSPVSGGQPVVHSGGGSETDVGVLEDGTLVAVMRNELGDPNGFGSKICRAEAGSWGSWRCSYDPRKYDSPLVFTFDDRVFLIARRNVTETGNYDLGRTDLTQTQKYFDYQTDYWAKAKRCAVWEVDSQDLTVQWLFDLPSAGDTCFPGVVPFGEEDAFLVYNYSSPIDGDLDISWLQGQTATTNIYSHVIRFVEAE